MKHIDLNMPFGQSLRLALSLPKGGDARANQDEAVADVLRHLYTIADGRSVQTTVGTIPIAPAIDPSLKDAPIQLESRSDLFALAERQTSFTSADKEDLTRSQDRQRADELPVHITPHNMRVGRTLREFIGRKLSVVGRVAGDALGAELVLRGRSGADARFSVCARVALPGRDLQSKASDANLYRAINRLVARLTRMARKRKTRLRKPRRMLRQQPVMPWLAAGASVFAL